MPIIIKEESGIKRRIVTIKKRSIRTRDQEEWAYHGAGNYNQVYLNQGKDRVYKIQKENETKDAITKMDDPERSVRIWDETNAKGAEKYEAGWTAPYIDGDDAPDDEVAHALADIYQDTGRIVVDAATNGNFKKSNEGKVICVDVGFALKLESHIDDGKSQDSLDFWESMQGDYREYFDESYPHSPRVISMVKALLVLQYYRPDARSVEVLKLSPVIVDELAGYYDDGTNFLESDCEKEFPVNLAYFQELALFEGLLSHEGISEDEKKSLCRLYLKGEFNHDNVTIILHLMNVLGFNFKASLFFSKIKKHDITKQIKLLIEFGKLKRQTTETIMVFKKANILTSSILNPEDIEMMEDIDFRDTVFNLYKNGNLNFLNFLNERLNFFNASVLRKSNIHTDFRKREMADDRHFSLYVRQLSDIHHLSTSSYGILSVLKESRILNNGNYNKLIGNQCTLLKLLLSKIKNGAIQFTIGAIKNQDDFDHALLNLIISDETDDLLEKKEKSSVLSIIVRTIESIKTYDASLEVKITAYEKMVSSINDSCLREERGWIYSSLWTHGKTKSYQDAMKALKQRLKIDIQNSKNDVNECKNKAKVIEILGYHTGRIPNPFATTSVGQISGLKH